LLYIGKGIAKLEVMDDAAVRANRRAGRGVIASIRRRREARRACGSRA